MKRYKQFDWYSRAMAYARHVISSYLPKDVTNALTRWKRSLEVRYRLLPDEEHSVARNYEVWQNYDWGKGGERVDSIA